MKISLRVTVFLVLLSVLRISHAQSNGAIAITNVTVISMETPDLKSHQTVLIEGAIIRKIGPTEKVKLPSGVRTVDGTGRYLIPGLTDMHVHFFEEQYNDHHSTTPLELKMMLANGVTTARILAGHPDYLRARQHVKNGDWPGPSLIVASPQLVGRWPWPAEFKNFEIVDTPGKAAAAVKKFKRDGYDEIKITFLVPKPSYDAIIQTAASEHIKVTGHVGPRVKLPAALAAGQQIEHMDEFIDMLLPDTTYNHGVSVSDMNIWSKKAWATVADLDESKIPALAKQVKRAGIYVSPTNYFFLSSFGEIPPEESIRQKPDYSYIPASLRESRWASRATYQKLGNTEPMLEKYQHTRKAMVRALWKEGVPLMAGSDSPEFFLVAGFSLHDELEAFVGAGLSTFAALQTATVNPARYIGDGRAAGTVTEGNAADLVLLDKNPLDDIHHARSITGIFKAGIFYDKVTIAQWLEEAKSIGDNN